MFWFFVIVIVVGVILAGIIGGVSAGSQSNTEHMPSIISRIIDWMN